MTFNAFSYRRPRSIPYVESLPKLLGDDLPQSSRFDINVDPRAVVGVKKTDDAIDAIVL
jgi:hypothetical protein